MQMGIGSVGQFTGVKAVGVEMGWAASCKLAARPCDNCRSASAAMFCKADAAFLCLGCDSGIHGANKLSSRHQRVWMCEACERAPASVVCKADAAVLCVSCDVDIHSANPLAGRHERFPVEPFYDAVESVAKVTGIRFLSVPGSGELHEVEEEEKVATSWLLPNPSENLSKKGGGVSAFDEMDSSPSLTFEDENLMDGVVGGAATVGLVPTGGANPSLGKGFDIDFRRSKISPLICENNQSLSHSASSSSHDFGVVPDNGNSKGGSERSDPSVRSLHISINTDQSNTKGTIATENQATRLRGLDREARVMRYRQKRKNRKFEKTVRYASRKAYAEARPRIKGRFIKRTEAEDDSICGTSPGDGLLGNEYGIVPTI